MFFSSVRKLAVLVLFALFLPVQYLPAYSAANTPDTQRQYQPEQMPTAGRQLRGVWITTVQNLDWPTSAASKITDDGERIKKSRDELSAILDKAVSMNLNAVFLQISPEGDAFYKSNIVPWSRYLTGVYGKDPGFDPLAFAVEEAHKRNLEIHAWFNPYRLSMDVKPATLQYLSSVNSVYTAHPEWVRTSMNRLVVDPGIPEAREWVVSRIMEVVDGYDIDGVHLDDYFYYENREGELKDDQTFHTYNSGGFSSKADWRRNNTYLLIKELSQKIRSSKQWIKFGVSPGGVWGNAKDLPGGSNTNTSFTNYDKSYADTKRWVEEELVDYIAPQIYFTFSNPRAPYGELAAWWSGVCRGKKVHLYIGQALYKINDDSDPHFNGEAALQEFSNQLKFNAESPDILGSIMFRFQNFLNPGKQPVVELMKKDIWSARILIPVMPWKGGKAPSAPAEGRLELSHPGVKVTWSGSDSGTAYYAVYRFNKGEAPDISSGSVSSKLIGTVRYTRGGRHEFTDFVTEGAGPEGVYYIVTALDRLHNESGPLVVTSYDTGEARIKVGAFLRWFFKIK